MGRCQVGFLPNPAQRDQRWLTEQVTSDRSVFLVAEHEPFVSQSSALVAFVIGTIETEIPL